MAHKRAARASGLRRRLRLARGNTAWHRRRAASCWLWSLDAVWKGTARARGRSFLRCKAALPRTTSSVHFVRWLARVVRLCATALAVSGEEAQHARLPHARAAPRWLWSLHTLRKGTARARGRPSSVEGRAPTCQPWRSLREPACACNALVRATALPLSWEEAQHARLSRVRAANCAGCCRSMPYGRAVHEREAALLQRAAVLSCASCGVHFVSQLARVSRLCANALPLFREKAQHARLPLVRAANCAGCGHFIPSGREVHAQETAILRCKAVNPRASYGVHFVSRLAHVARLCATALAVAGEEAQHARLPRARAAPRWLWSLRALRKGTARARGRPSSVEGRAPTNQLRRPLREPAYACSALVRHCAGSL